MNLEFRRFLTEYGITCQEYESMEESKKQELIDKFNKKNAVTMGDIGQGIQGCGAVLFLLPTMAFLLFIVFAMLFM